jgi:CRP/FNR family transcriptional regulator, cyclic AMP receptor protein
VKASARTITPAAFAVRFPRLTDALASEDVAALLDALQVRDATAGEALVAEGTPTGDLFLVWDGDLDVTMATPSGDRRLATVSPGSYFGEVSLLDPGPAGASVVTEQGCVALRLSRAGLDELRRRSPAAAVALLREACQSLAARLRAAAAYRPGPVDG